MPQTATGEYLVILVLGIMGVTHVCKAYYSENDKEYRGCDITQIYFLEFLNLNFIFRKSLKNTKWKICFERNLLQVK